MIISGAALGFSFRAMSARRMPKRAEHAGYFSRRCQPFDAPHIEPPTGLASHLAARGCRAASTDAAPLVDTRLGHRVRLLVAFPDAETISPAHTSDFFSQLCFAYAADVLNSMRETSMLIISRDSW